MNKIHKVIFNRNKNRYEVVSELASSRGGKCKSKTGTFLSGTWLRMMVVSALLLGVPLTTSLAEAATTPTNTTGAANNQPQLKLQYDLSTQTFKLVKADGTALSKDDLAKLNELKGNGVYLDKDGKTINYGSSTTGQPVGLVYDNAIEIVDSSTGTTTGSTATGTTTTTSGPTAAAVTADNMANSLGAMDRTIPYAFDATKTEKGATTVVNGVSTTAPDTNPTQNQGTINIAYDTQYNTIQILNRDGQANKPDMTPDTKAGETFNDVSAILLNPKTGDDPATSDTVNTRLAKNSIFIGANAGVAKVDPSAIGIMDSTTGFIPITKSGSYLKKNNRYELYTEGIERSYTRVFDNLAIGPNARIAEDWLRVDEDGYVLDTFGEKTNDIYAGILYSGNNGNRYRNTVIGSSAVTYGYETTVLGSGSMAWNAGSVAIGNQAIAGGGRSISLGSYSTTNNGLRNYALGNDDVIIGSASMGFGNTSLAIGRRNVVGRPDSDKISKDGNILSVTQTHNNDKKGTQDSVAIGVYNVVQGNNAYTVGNANYARGNNTASMGYGVTITDDRSIGIGTGMAAGDYSLIGDYWRLAKVINTNFGEDSTGADGEERYRKFNEGWGSPDDPGAFLVKGTAAVGLGSYTQVNGNSAVALATGDAPQFTDNDASATAWKDVKSKMTAYTTAQTNYLNAVATKADNQADLKTKVDTAKSALTTAANDYKTKYATSENTYWLEAMDIREDRVALQELKDTTPNDPTIATKEKALQDKEAAFRTKWLTNYSFVEGESAVGIGKQVKVDGDSALGIGRNVRSLGERALAVGDRAKALSDDAMAFGGLAKSYGERAMAIGGGAYAEGDGTLALGTYTVADFTPDTTVDETGKLVNNSTGADAENSTDVKANQQKPNALAMGAYTKVTGENSLAIGFGTLNDSGLTKAGDQIQPSDINYNTVSGKESILLGSYSKLPANTSILLGNHSTVTGDTSALLGTSSTLNGKQSMLLGTSSTVTGDVSSLLGTSSTITGNQSILLGSKSSITGDNSGILGTDSKIADAHDSILIGNHGFIGNDRVMAFGNNINIKAFDPAKDGADNNTSGSVFLGDRAGYVSPEGHSRDLGTLPVLGTGELKNFTENLDSTKGAAKGYNSDWTYIYLYDANSSTPISTSSTGTANSSDGSTNDRMRVANAAVAVKSDYAGGNATVGVVSVGSRYEKQFNDASIPDSVDGRREAMQKYIAENGSNITVPVELERTIKRNNVELKDKKTETYNISVAAVVNDKLDEQYGYMDFTDEDKEKITSAVNKALADKDYKYQVIETRRIQNVAPGLIGMNSTDAINGSQLYATNQIMGNLAASLALNMGDKVTITEDGEIIVNDGKGSIGWFAKVGTAEGATGNSATVNTGDATKDETFKTDGDIVKVANAYTFKAGQNINLTQTDKALEIAVAKELKDITSITTEEQDGKHSVLNSNGFATTELVQNNGVPTGEVRMTAVTNDGVDIITVDPSADKPEDVTRETSLTKDGLTTDGTVKVTDGKSGKDAEGQPITEKAVVELGKEVANPNETDPSKQEYYGTVDLVGKNNSAGTLFMDHGDTTLDATKNVPLDKTQPANPSTNPDGSERLVYTTLGLDKEGKATTIDHQVATMDDGFFLNTSGNDKAKQAKAGVKLNNTINVVDGANTTVSTVTSADGTHTFHIDVTGLPVAYTDSNNNPLTKIGDNYFKADDAKDGITKVGDKYYKTPDTKDTKLGTDGKLYKASDLDESGAPNPDATPITPINSATPSNSVSIVNSTDGTVMNPAQVKNVDSSLTGEVGNGLEAPKDPQHPTAGEQLNSNQSDGTKVSTPGSNTFLQNLKNLDGTENPDAQDQKAEKARAAKDNATLHSAATVEDLKNLAQSPLFFEGDAADGVNGNAKNTFGRELGQKVNIIGGETDPTKLTPNNIGVISNGTDTLTVQLAKELQELTSITTEEDTDGNKTTIGTNGMTVTNESEESGETNTTTFTREGMTIKDYDETNNLDLPIESTVTVGKDGITLEKNDELDPENGNQVTKLTNDGLTTDGKVTVNGTAQDPIVELNTKIDTNDSSREYGTIMVKGKQGTEGDITLDKGATALTHTDKDGKVVDPNNPPIEGKTPSMDRLTYTTIVKDANEDPVKDPDGTIQTITHQVATMDDGFFLNTSGNDKANQAKAGVKLNNTINVVDGANTTVSTVTSADGTHTFHIDVTGLPVAYTDSNNNPLTKVGDKYFTADDAKDGITKVGDKYYKTNEVENGVPKQDAQPVTPVPEENVTNNVSLVNKDGTAQKPAQVKNVQSALSGDDISVGNGLEATENPADGEQLNSNQTDGTKVSTPGSNTFLQNLKDLDPNTDKATLNSAATVEDLKNLAQSPLFFEGDAAAANAAKDESGNAKNTFGRELGQKVNIIGGVTDPMKLTPNNIGVISNGTDTLTVQLAKDLTDLHSVTTTDENGKVTSMNGGGLATTEVVKDKNGAPTGEIKTTKVTPDGVRVTDFDPSKAETDPNRVTETTLGKDGLTTDGNVIANGDTSKIAVTNGKDGADAKDLVSLGKGNDGSGDDKEYGTIGLDGKNGTNTTITLDKGDTALTHTDKNGTVVDPNNPKDGDEPQTMDRLTYTTTVKNPDNTDKVINHQIATMDDGFFLNTSGNDKAGQAKAGVKLNNTINVVDGANTAVSTVTSADGTHTFHIDVTGLPVAYTDSNNNPLTKIGDNYFKADEAKDGITQVDGQYFKTPDAKDGITKVGDAYYKNTDLDENGAPKPDVKPVTPVSTQTATNNVTMVNPDGTAKDPAQVKNVASGLTDADGNKVNNLDNAVQTNAVNVGDLSKATKAATTEVTGTGAADVTSRQAKDGHMIYNVHVDELMKVQPVDPKQTIERAGDGKYYTPKALESLKDKTYVPDGEGGGNWYNSSDVKDGVPINGATPLKKEDLPQAIAQENLKNSVVNPNGNGPTVVDNVKSVLDGDVNNGSSGDNVDVKNPDGTVTPTKGNNDFLKELTALNDKVDPDAKDQDAEKARANKDKAKLNSVTTVRDLQKLAESPLFFEGDVADGVNGNTKNTFDRKLGQKVNIVGGVTDPTQLTPNNIGVISNGTDTLTVQLAKDLTNLHSVTTTDENGKVTSMNGGGLATTEVVKGENGNPTGEIKTTKVTPDGVRVTDFDPSKAENDPNRVTETTLGKDGLTTDGTVKVTNGKDGADAKDLVTVTEGKDNGGHIIINGKEETVKDGDKTTTVTPQADITVTAGDSSLYNTAKDPKNIGNNTGTIMKNDAPVVSMDRIQYADREGKPHQVATLDDGFYLTTEHTQAADVASVKLNNTIKVEDGVNTKVSTVASTDGTHTFHIDVVDIPTTYTATKEPAKDGEAPTTESVSKVGNTYQLADGRKLTQSGDKYYTPDQLENGQPKDGAKGYTINNSVSLVNPNNPKAPAQLNNVASGLGDKALKNVDENSPEWTNAVNVGDLSKAMTTLTDNGFGLTGNNGEVTKKLGETVTVVGGMAESEARTDKNTFVNVEKDADGKGEKLVVQIAKNLTDLTSVTTTDTQGNETKMSGNSVTTRDKNGHVTEMATDGVRTIKMELNNDGEPTGQYTLTEVTPDGVNITTETPNGDNKPNTVTKTKLGKDGLTTDGNVIANGDTSKIAVTNGKDGDDAKDLVSLGKGTVDDANATDKEYGTIDLDGKNGTNTTITLDKGETALTHIDKDGNVVNPNNPDNQTMNRLTYTTTVKNPDGTNKVINHQIATMDDGFFLNTSGNAPAKQDKAGVKLNHTINVVDGANTRVSAVTSSADGTHTFHIDINGLPVSYTDSNNNPLTKVGDTYFKADEAKDGITQVDDKYFKTPDAKDGITQVDDKYFKTPDTKGGLTKVGDNYYKDTDLDGGKPKEGAKPVTPVTPITQATPSNSMSIVHPDGSVTTPTQVKNVASGLTDENGNKVNNLADAVQTNAVNVGDLSTLDNSLTNKGFGLTGNRTDKNGNYIPVNRPLGSTIPVKGGMLDTTSADAITGANTYVDVEGDELVVKMSKDLIDLNSVTTEDEAGNKTVTNGKGVKITDKDGNSNESTVAGTTIADTNGNTSIATAAGDTFKDSKGNTNVSNAAGDTITDKDGNTNASTATSNTLTDKAGNSNISTATGNTIKDKDGNINTSTATGNTIKDAKGNETDIKAGDIKTTVTDGDGNIGSTEIRGNTVSLHKTDKGGKQVGPKTEITNNGMTITPLDEDGTPVTDPNKQVSLTDKGLNNGGNQITNVASGVTDADGNTVDLANAVGTNGVNVNDLRDAAKAATTEVKGDESGSGAAVVTGPTKDKGDGHPVYTVHVDKLMEAKSVDGSDITLASDNKYYTNAEGKTLVDGKWYNTEDIKGKQLADDGKWYDEDKVKDGQPIDGAKASSVEAITGENVPKLAELKNSLNDVNHPGEAVALDNVKSSINGAVGNGASTKDTIGDADAPEKGSNTFIDNLNKVGDSISAKAAATTGDLKNLANTPMFFDGDKADTKAERNQFDRKLGQQIHIKGGAEGELSDGNIGVVSNGEDTLTVKLAKDVTGLNSVESNTVQVHDALTVGKDGDTTVVKGATTTSTFRETKKDDDGNEVTVTGTTETKGGKTVSTVTKQGNDGKSETSSTTVEGGTTTSTITKDDGKGGKETSSTSIKGDMITSTDKDGATATIKGNEISTSDKEGNATLNIKGDKVTATQKDKDGNTSVTTIDGSGISSTADKTITDDDGNKMILHNSTNVNADGISSATRDDDNNVIRQTDFNNVDGMTIKSNPLKDEKGNLIKVDGNPVYMNTTNVSDQGISIVGPNQAGTGMTNVNLTSKGLDNGGNRIVNVAPGVDPTDGVNVSQLRGMEQNIHNEIGDVGATAAALAGLKAIQYDPLEPTQVMAAVGTYRGKQAAALGLAHYKNEDTMFHMGVTIGSQHTMANIGVTYKFGRTDEKKAVPDRYKAGPISSTYVMQDEVTALKQENARMRLHDEKMNEAYNELTAMYKQVQADNEQMKKDNEEMKRQIALLMKMANLSQ